MDNLPIGLHAYNNFMKFRNHQLIIIKRKYNLGAEVTEDIFQDAIIVAIKSLTMKEANSMVSFLPCLRTVSGIT
ncbi:MAG: hypothetical protein IPL67_05265 [Ignavibacteria bacterium]|nr:hypothetical protein [Ignavibacteria bacterium]